MSNPSQQLIDEAARKFMTVAAETCDIKQVLQCAHEILGLPIVLRSPVQRFKMSCGTENIPHEHLMRKDTIEERKQWMSLVASSLEPVIDEDNGLPFRAMCFDVRSKKVMTGQLSMMETRPFNNTDSGIFKALATVLGCLMRADEFSLLTSERSYQILIKTLLCEQADQQSIENYTTVHNINPNEQKRVICLCTPDNNTIEYALVQGDLYSLFSLYSIQFENMLVCLCNPPANQLGESSLLNYLRKHDLFAGVSQDFTDLLLLRDHYLQAKFAAEYACKKRAAMLLYHQYMIEDIIDLCASQRKLLTYCRPEICRLLKYDREYKTILIDTLFNYIESMCNMVETARRCSVHHNTVKYRMQLIREITGLKRITARDFAEIYFSLIILREEAILNI